ncbi:hypothetical protein [Flavobacterium sp.]|uniref:hypothetical protein n=1 Tax=Flavobacterium sp. TaxID=239 RepID=UPI003752D5AE
MKYIIGILCICFVIANLVFTLNPIFKNIVLGIMAVIALFYIITNKEENGIGKIFDKDGDKKSKSIFNIKDLFKK